MIPKSGIMGLAKIEMRRKEPVPCLSFLNTLHSAADDYVANLPDLGEFVGTSERRSTC